MTNATLTTVTDRNAAHPSGRWPQCEIVVESEVIWKYGEPVDEVFYCGPKYPLDYDCTLAADTPF